MVHSHSLAGAALAACLLFSSLCGAQPDPLPPSERASWVERFKSLTGHNPAAFNVGPQVVKLHPDDGLAIVVEVWPALTNDEVKRGILKAFTFADHPRVLDVLDFGAVDESDYVRGTAFTYLSWYALQDFSVTSEAYPQWRDETIGQSKDNILADSMRKLVVAMRGGLTPQHLEMLQHAPPNEATSAAARSSGVLEFIEETLTEPTTSNKIRQEILRALYDLQLDAEFTQRVIVPIALNEPDPSLRGAAIGLVGRSEAPWAFDVLSGMFPIDPKNPIVNEIADALAELKDPRAIPILIGAIDADNSYDTVYKMGAPLGKLVGVDYSVLHDGAWWRRWWELNKSNYPESARATPIPDFPKSPHGETYVPYPESADTIEGMMHLIVEALRENRPNDIQKYMRDLVARGDKRIIPELIGVIDADNSYHTIYGVGYFALGKLTEVRYSPFHDGAWWRRWWEENKSSYPEDVQQIPIPNYPKTIHGEVHTPFPPDLDSYEGASRFIREAFAARDFQIIRDLANELAEQDERRAIPLMIGVIDADNSAETISQIGGSLRRLTDVSHLPYHDGAWWRAWWEKNKANYPPEVREIPIPDLPKTPHGETYTPYNADLESYEGLIALLQSELRHAKLADLGLSPLAEHMMETLGPRAIPALIGVIEADNTEASIYGVGYFGLSRATGVQYDESRDGPWWRAWWEANKQRYPEEVQQIEIPDFAEDVEAGREFARAAGATGPMADVADVPAQDRFAEGNKNMRYFLIGAPENEEPPADGYALLVVLPGGGGSANMHPFIRRIYKNALPKGFLVAQLVSKEWTRGQFEQLVWPTGSNPWPDAQFTTEVFLETVIAEVKSQFLIRADDVFTLSWSSGGPAAYAASLRPDTPVKGSFVAMSVFKPEQLPQLDAANGHAYFLYHSPDDFIPIDMALDARDMLGSRGAATRLLLYDGGHGWRGDVYGDIRLGIRWLMRNSAGRR